MTDGLKSLLNLHTHASSYYPKLKSFGSLEITGRRAVDGLFDITFHYFSHCSRRNEMPQTGTNIRYTVLFLDIAQTRYCVDISVYHRYIGDGSVYRRSFKDKFVTIRAIGDHELRNRVYIGHNRIVNTGYQLGSPESGFTLGGGLAQGAPSSPMGYTFTGGPAQRYCTSINRVNAPLGVRNSVPEWGADPGSRRAVAAAADGGGAWAARTASGPVRIRGDIFAAARRWRGRALPTGNLASRAARRGRRGGGSGGAVAAGQGSAWASLGRGSSSSVCGLT